jgi:hypothetical protein
LDGVFDQVFDLFVAFDGDGDDSAAAGGDLLNVAEGGSYLRTLLGSFVAMKTARGLHKSQFNERLPLPMRLWRAYHLGDLV